MILEKAWAKIHGGYLNTEFGQLEEALHDLTGAPTDTYYMTQEPSKENKDLWKILQEAITKQFLITCGTRSDKPKVTDPWATQKEKDEINKNYCKDFAESGLVTEHAYSIRSVFTLPGEMEGEGNEARWIIQLQNPVHKDNVHDNLKGALGEASREVEKIIKSNPGTASLAHPKTFYMDYEHFCHYFYLFSICKYHKDYYHCAERFVTSCEQPTLFKFTIKESGNENKKMYIILSQKNIRMRPQKDRYTYSAVSILLIRDQKGEKGPTFVGSKGEITKDLSLEAPCVPGNYTAYVITPWKHEVNVLGFSIYSPEKIKEITIMREEALPSRYISNVMLDKARKDKHKRIQFKDLKDPLVKYHIENPSYEWGYIYIINKSEDTQVTLYLVINKEEQVQVKFNPNVRNTFYEMITPPKKDQILAFQMRGKDSKFTFTKRYHFIPKIWKCIDLVNQAGLCEYLPNKKDVKDPGAHLHIYRDQNTIIYLHHNLSATFKLNRFLKMKLENAQIEPNQTPYIHVALAPQGYQYTVIQKKDRSSDVFEVEIEETKTDEFVKVN